MHPSNERQFLHELVHVVPFNFPALPSLELGLVELLELRIKRTNRRPVSDGFSAENNTNNTSTFGESFRGSLFNRNAVF